MADISNNAVFSQTDASNNSGTVPTFAEGMLPSGVNDSARALQGALKRWHEHLSPTLDSAGTANAQTLTYTVAPTAYVTGDLYGFMVGAGLTNTGATTLNVNGLGAKDIFIGSNTLQGGELRESQFVLVGYDGTQFQLLRGITPAWGGFLPSDPAGTASAAGVMMGIGSTCSVTPKVSGVVQIHVAGDITLDAAGTATTQIRYGTGAAPANAVPLTGTTAGSLVTVTQNDAARVPFSLIGHITGLTVGAAYWIDISLSNSVGAGTYSSRNLSVSVQEMPR